MLQLALGKEKETPCSTNEVPSKEIRRVKFRFVNSMIFVILALFVVGLLACGLTIEIRILSRNSVPLLFSGSPPCSPIMVDLNNVKYHSNHTYYNQLREMFPLQSPVFKEDHTTLCSNTIHLRRKQRSFGKCLPISGRKDQIFCSGADRMDILEQNSSKTVCHASVLHMMLVEVYEELQVLDKSPIIVYGSLLGAVRNQGMIPYTEDADIAYRGRLRVADDLQRLLWQKGYRLFFQNIWRVCVAPTHPLATKLYDPTLSISTMSTIPYLDMYSLNHQVLSGEWKLQEMKKVNGSVTIPDEKVIPLSKITINGQHFDTVHDPEYFLERMYGGDYMIPKPRKTEMFGTFPGVARQKKPKLTQTQANITI